MVTAIILISMLMLAICLYLANECHPELTPASERYSLALLMSVISLIDIAVLNHKEILGTTLILTFLGMVSILVVLINQAKIKSKG